MVRVTKFTTMNATDAPLVSVVMPFLNPNRGFLQEAVESILSQEYRPLEIVFVDDGSQEILDDLIRSWCTDDKVPLRVLHHENRRNRGISASRNLGINESTGKYIAFLDADDVWLPGKIREQCAVMENDETLSMVFGLTRYWFDWHDSHAGEGRDFTTRPGFQSMTVFSPPDYIAGMLRGRYLAPGPSNLMARRDMVLACGGFEEEFPGLYDDQVFVAKLALTTEVCAVPKLWDKYRQHADSMMARVGGLEEELMARENFLRWLSAFCRESDLQYPTLSEAIAKDRWLAKSTWTRTGSASYRWIRWAKKWLLRLEEIVIPGPIRWNYSNR